MRLPGPHRWGGRRGQIRSRRGRRRQRYRYQRCRCRCRAACPPSGPLSASASGSGLASASASVHTFRIALSELGEIGWMPDIIARVHAEAPHIRVEVVALEPDLLADALNRGAVDLAISPAAVRGAFEPTHVKQERYNALVSREHDLATSELTLESYTATRHVSLTSDTGGPLVDLARRRSGFSVQPAVTIRHLATLPQLLLREPTLMATIPETIAKGWASNLPLVALELPFDMDPIEIVLYRRRTSQDIGALEWFHREVARAVAGSPGEFSALVPGPDD